MARRAPPRMKRISKSLDSGLRSLDEAIDDLADTLFSSYSKDKQRHSASSAALSPEESMERMMAKFEASLEGNDPERVAHMMELFRKVAEVHAEELGLNQAAKDELANADTAATKGLLARLKPSFMSRRKQKGAFTKVLTVEKM